MLEKPVARTLVAVQVALVGDAWGSEALQMHWQLEGPLTFLAWNSGLLLPLQCWLAQALLSSCQMVWT